jgi:hypothetical protein
MSQPLIYQRVCLCANLLWTDLARADGKGLSAFSSFLMV